MTKTRKFCLGNALVPKLPQHK